VKWILTLALLNLLAFVALPFQAEAGFSLGISPVRWEAAGKPGETVRNVVKLRSGAGAMQNVKVTVCDWTLTEDGAPVYDKAGSMADSAASWIRLQPDELSVYPRQEKVVKVSIEIPSAVPPGSYRAALLFEPPGAEQKGVESAASVFIRGRLAFPIYVTVGDARPDGEIIETAWNEVPGKGLTLAMKIRNGGNAHLRMSGFFSATSRSKSTFEGTVSEVPILPGQIRWVPMEFQGETPPPGADLDLTIHVDLGRGERELKVNVHALDKGEGAGSKSP
jgi:fimbrial chaperone protein